MMENQHDIETLRKHFMRIAALNELEHIAQNAIFEGLVRETVLCSIPFDRAGTIASFSEDWQLWCDMNLSENAMWDDFLK